MSSACGNAMWRIQKHCFFQSLWYSWYCSSTVASLSEVLLYTSGYRMESMVTKPCSLVMEHLANCFVFCVSVGLQRWTSVALSSPSSKWKSTWPRSHLPLSWRKTTTSWAWMAPPLASLATEATLASLAEQSTNWLRNCSCCLLGFFGFTNWQESGNRPGSVNVVISMASTCFIKWISKAVVFWSLVAKAEIVLCFRSLVKVESRQPCRWRKSGRCKSQCHFLINPTSKLACWKLWMDSSAASRRLALVVAPYMTPW